MWKHTHHSIIHIEPYNQYIIPTSISSKNLAEAQKGLAFWCLPGLLGTLFVVESTRVLPQQCLFHRFRPSPDEAYPSWLSFDARKTWKVSICCLSGPAIGVIACFKCVIAFTPLYLSTMEFITPRIKREAKLTMWKVGSQSLSIVSLVIAMICAKPC